MMTIDDDYIGPWLAMASRGKQLRTFTIDVEIYLQHLIRQPDLTWYVDHINVTGDTNEGVSTTFDVDQHADALNWLDSKLANPNPTETE